MRDTAGREQLARFLVRTASLLLLPVELDDVLRIICPRCGEVHEDVYETLHERQPTEWLCSSCHKHFSVLLADCEHCAHENVQIALANSEQAELQGVRCESCGKWCLIREEESVVSQRSQQSR